MLLYVFAIQLGGLSLTFQIGGESERVHVHVAGVQNDVFFTFSVVLFELPGLKLKIMQWLMKKFLRTPSVHF